MSIKNAFGRFSIVVLFCSVGQLATAQGSYGFGCLPAVNLNVKLKYDWTLNGKIESRQLFKSGDFGGENSTNYDYVLTDFSLLAAKKMALNARLSAGYLMRFEEGFITSRFIQQYTAVQLKNGYRFAHRFVSDQTFTPHEKMEFRLRYRLTAEIPLNGESVDHNEFYLKLNVECLNRFQGDMYDLEFRFIPLLGFDLKDECKVETGLDYRINSLLINTTEQNFWWSLNFFIEI